MDRLGKLREGAIVSVPAPAKATHIAQDPIRLREIGEAILTRLITFRAVSGNASAINPGVNMFTSKFTKLRKILGPKFGSKEIATAQTDASKDPQKFLKKMKEPSIKKLKGVAF